jgi:hypothetical protein
MLTDRRDALGHLRVQTVNRLQRILGETFPGQRTKNLSALQAKVMLTTVRPQDIAGKTDSGWPPKGSPTSSWSTRS